MGIGPRGGGEGGAALYPPYNGAFLGKWRAEGRSPSALLLSPKIGGTRGLKQAPEAPAVIRPYKPTASEG